MTHQKKTAADYGQLSLFEETVPEWLQPAESVRSPVTNIANADEEDDLGQFTAWLQQSKRNTSP